MAHHSGDACAAGMGDTNGDGERSHHRRRDRPADTLPARVGVLALQGGIAAHARALRALGLEPVCVRAARDLENVSGLVLPGGESGVQLRLLSALDLVAPILAFAAARRPMLATCAGLVLCARRVRNPAQTALGLLDVSVERNGWGRQVDSFEAFSDEGRPLTFIRAPRIVELGQVEVLSRFRGEPVLIRQERIVGASFHPELTGELSLHREVFNSLITGAS